MDGILEQLTKRIGNKRLHTMFLPRSSVLCLNNKQNKLKTKYILKKIIETEI